MESIANRDDDSTANIPKLDENREKATQAMKLEHKSHDIAFEESAPKRRPGLLKNKCYSRSPIARSSKLYRLWRHVLVMQLLKQNDAQSHLLIHPRVSQIRKTAVFSSSPEEVMAA